MRAVEYAGLAGVRPDQAVMLAEEVAGVGDHVVLPAGTIVRRQTKRGKAIARQIRLKLVR